MLTLYSTPVIYLWLHQFRQRWQKRRSARQAEHPVGAIPPPVHA
jgi:hypothetical protein